LRHFRPVIAPVRRITDGRFVGHSISRKENQ